MSFARAGTVLATGVVIDMGMSENMDVMENVEENIIPAVVNWAANEVLSEPLIMAEGFIPGIDNLAVGEYDIGKSVINGILSAGLNRALDYGTYDDNTISGFMKEAAYCAAKDFAGNIVYEKAFN